MEILYRLLAKAVDVAPGERRRVGGMFALLGLVITTSYILKPVRSSLFLSQFGSERLPYVYMLVAVVLGVVAALFARWAPLVNQARLFEGAAYVFASNLVVFWVLIVFEWRWVGFAFYVWVSIFTALMPSLFWLLANYVFYANEGRRLFPVVMVPWCTTRDLGPQLSCTHGFEVPHEHFQTHSAEVCEEGLSREELA